MCAAWLGGTRQAARKVADHLGTEHHNFEYSVEEGLDAIPEVRCGTIDPVPGGATA